MVHLKTHLKHPVLNGQIPILEIHHGNPAEASKSSWGCTSIQFLMNGSGGGKKNKKQTPHRMQLWEKYERFLAYKYPQPPHGHCYN